ncbi:phenylalanine--tRNA ligase subunit alpha [candidate division KSB1 bacterium]|nr:phenylalanine--tRNA ligase subunit alpha [candidate division KSB1 bacterium]
MIQQLQDIRTQFEKEIEACSGAEVLEALRIKYLSKKGIISGYLALLGKVAPEERPLLGQQLNELKSLAQNLIAERVEGLQLSHRTHTFFDTSLPGIKPLYGRKHPLRVVQDEIKSIFTSMGFRIEMGPELESDYYNFEALNIPVNHPARDSHDTFYITDNLLLRTHTSPVQVRTMEKFKPPIRIIAPGRCFRKDAIDATHYPTFHQVEGLVVDEGINFADLKGIILAFAKKLLGEDIKIRFRPSYFPFTEPSAEYDFSCFKCGGTGCRICKGTGWIEISGAGMVHPAVFKYVDYDSEKYTGYAFGMGIERIAMLRYQIDDIRVFYENDLRFLQQF